MNILLIDDHLLFTQSLKHVLEEMFVVNNVCILKNAKNIDEYIRINDISVILLDIHLGEENGFDVGRYLKKNYPQIPIVFLTGFDYMVYKTTAINIGVEGFFSKTIDPFELIKNLIEIVKNPRPLRKTDFENNLILTKREVQILNLLADGLKQKEIGDKLNISRRTVQSTIYHIYEKFGVNTPSSAIKKAYELGLIEFKN